MMQTKLSTEQCNNKSNKLKCHYFEECNKNKSDYVFYDTKAQRKYTNKWSKHYLKQYEGIKKVLQYESPLSSVDSLSD